MFVPDFNRRIDELTVRFVGREWLLTKIDEYLRQKEGNYLVITGEPGIGKSAVAARLIQVRKIHAHYFCTALEGGKLDPSTFCASLSNQLALRLIGFSDHIVEQTSKRITGEVKIGEMAGGTAYGVFINQLIVQSKSASDAFQTLVRNPLANWCSAHKDEKVVLLVDALDEATQIDAHPNIVDLISQARDLPDQVRWVLTSRPGNHLSRLPGARLLILDDSPENVRDLGFYIDSVLTEPTVLAALQAGNSDASEFSKRLTERSGGNFLYINYVLGGIKKDAVAGRALSIDGRMPDGLEGLYLEFLDRVLANKGDNDWKHTYRPALGILATAQEGLEFNHLVSLAGVPSQEVNDVLVDLAQFLDVSGNNETRRSRIYHTSFIDFLTDRVRNRKYWIDAGHYHRQIADKYFGEFASRWAECDQYGLRYLPTHLIRAGLHPKLRQLLFDFDWLQAKVDSVGLSALLADFNLLAPDVDGQLVQGAIRQMMHLLAKDKTQLAGQLIGRLGYYRTPEISELVAKASQWKGSTWLRPIIPTLSPPGALLQSIPAHEHRIYGVAATSDGKKLVSASLDHTPKVWDLETGEELQVLRGHTASAVRVAMMSDNRRVVSASHDGSLRVWDIENGSELFALKVHEEWINDLALTSNGLLAITASEDQTVKVIDLHSGAIRHTLEGHTKGVWAVAVTPDGKYGLSGSWDNSLRVWDLERGVVSSVHRFEEGSVHAIAVSSEGHLVLCAVGTGPGSDNIIVARDLKKRENIFTLRGHSNRITSVVISADGRRAVSGSWDETMKVWDLESGTELQTIKNNADINALTFIGLRRVVSASSDGSLKLWEIESEMKGLTTRAHAQAVSVVTTAGESLAISGSEDGTLKVWNLANGEELKVLGDHRSMVLAVAVTQDVSCGVSASADGSLRVWNLETGTELHTLKGHTGPVEAVAFTADGRRIISASTDKSCKIWDLKSGREIMTLEDREAKPRIENLLRKEGVYKKAMALTPDGRHGISVLGDRENKGMYFVAWDLELGTGRQFRLEHTDWVNAVAITRDGRLGISASDDYTLEVWDLDAGTKKSTLLGHRDWVKSVVITPDGGRVVSGCSSWGIPNDSSVKVWDIEAGIEKFTLIGHTSSITSLAVTPDGQRAVSTSQNGTLKVWDIVEGKEVASFTFEHTITTCAVSLDGLTVLAGDRSGQVHFLHLEGSA